MAVSVQTNQYRAKNLERNILLLLNFKQANDSAAHLREGSLTPDLWGPPTS